MKKKILAMMLSCALAATSLAGCSLLHKNDQSGPINQKSETDDTTVKPEADPVPDLPVDLLLDVVPRHILVGKKPQDHHIDFSIFRHFPAPS